MDGVLDNVKDGKIYKYEVHSYYDYESGVHEADGSEFIEFKQDNTF